MYEILPKKADTEMLTQSISSALKKIELGIPL